MASWRRLTLLFDVILFVLLLLFTLEISGQVLTPPYFNLAKNRKISATSTCGVGVIEPELFCRLTGASSFRNSPDIIHGQVCDHCDPAIASQYHPPEYAIDGTQKWWQSPPLSRSMDLNRVNVTIDLGQEFHVAYIYIRMANSPRPGIWALERSTDFGKTWSAWQYFADTASDCLTFFNTRAVRSHDNIVSDDSVICTSEFSSIVPLVNGEIIVSLVNKRPNAASFSDSETLQNWTKATNVRLNLIRTKTLLGHLMALARQDSTVTRRYFYAIRDISLGGRCVCNGHAETCDRTDPNDVSNRLLCNCRHNTCGDQCGHCCPGYVQRAWERGKFNRKFKCEPCNCHGHSNECVYSEEVDKTGTSMDIRGKYEGGGVCQNCRDNTSGVNCETCASGFYRPPGVLPNDTQPCRPCSCDMRVSTGECEAETGRCLCRSAYTGLDCDRCSLGHYGYPTCVPCDCNINGTEESLCTVNGGFCPCKSNFGGRNCDMCGNGYYDFPHCTACGCKAPGARSGSCDPDDGQCDCHENFGGQECILCAHGYFSHPKCDLCDCEKSGTLLEVCLKDTGRCLCKKNFAGSRCDACAPGYYNYPQCQECGCAQPGSVQTACHENGQCVCHPNFGGRTCGQCRPGYYKYSRCKPCSCDPYGSAGLSCDQETGACTCRSHFVDLRCNKCAESFYNYPMCEECNCNPAGAKEVLGLPLGGCGLVNVGRLCECKERVGGRICDRCHRGYWNLNINNPLGCQECECNAFGTVSGASTCDVKSGQCVCKVTVGGTTCDRCRDGFYNLQQHSVYGCQDCGCDVGGSTHTVCEKLTGKCACRPRVGGRACHQPIENHYFPSLHQEKYELEMGKTPRNTAVRYDYNNKIFPGFSWKGYVIIDPLQQPVALIDVDIRKPSLYRLLYRYVNKHETAVRGKVVITPTKTTDSKQESSVVFEPSPKPGYARVAQNGIPSTFVFNSGKWTISINAEDTLYLDYVVLLPQAYYEATVLKERVTQPCLVPNDAGPCIHYQYPPLTAYKQVFGSAAVVAQNRTRAAALGLDNEAIVAEYGYDGLGLLNDTQKSFFLDLTTTPGVYVLLVDYYNPVSGKKQNVAVNIASRNWRLDGSLHLDHCEFSTPCRQIVRGSDGQHLVFNTTHTTGYTPVTLTGEVGVNVAIAKVTAIPVEHWNLGYVHPSIACIRIDMRCVRSTYIKPTGSVRIDFEVENKHLVGTDVPEGYQGSSNQLVKLLPMSNVTVSGNVRLVTQYVIVTHYHQPRGAALEVDITLIIGGQMYQGVFKPMYCANVAGCRGVVHFDTDKVIDFKNTNYTLSFNNTNDLPLWLDYYLLVPAAQYLPSFLEIEPIDKATQYISECVDQDYNIISPSSDFCRASTFSVTTSRNNGAVACKCDVDGSLTLQCDSWDGQCQCRDSIIGRTCAACRSGYYGFPRCTACSCPIGICDPISGDCICPPRVTGNNCDSCEPETFGYDAIRGCESCHCNPHGVADNDLNCDPFRGRCKCLPNVGGQRCDVCLAGYHSLPRCLKCDCDTRGARKDVCNQISARCHCKSNTVGERCDACRPDTFSLQDKNPSGCIECFCFGTTARCSSSRLRRVKIRDMTQWSVSNVRTSDVSQGTHDIQFRVEDKVLDNSTAIYWIAPSSYLGNMLKSYGGTLNYTARFFLHPVNVAGNRGLIQPDVILKGQNLTLVLSVAEQPQASRPLSVSVDLVEYKFKHMESGDTVTRDQFMMVLVNLEALHVRASYYTNVSVVVLSNVSMDSASDVQTGELALNVEQCACPSNYEGTSCENCADGYYRSKTGPYLGVCVRCQCNNHAEICDRITGECLNCTGNTEGIFCEKCLPGHFGDPQRGPCSMCTCPMATELNNFAYSCEADMYQRVTKCHCQPGYAGDHCQECAAGYWGTPLVKGGECGKCGCSGNINSDDPKSCHHQTGACLLCASNTAGSQCGVCREWYYGDAVIKKNCQSCACDQRGTDYCDNVSGACVCKINVIGRICERCAPDHYGYGSACEFCNCQWGSANGQCDDVTGACQCLPGVTGDKCDRCMAGYWNDSDTAGCKSCPCMTSKGAVQCDPKTGRCECLKGVTGINCDQCLPRWVLMPEQGCSECDSCVNRLLDDLDQLKYLLTNSLTELNNLTVSVSAFKRLERIQQHALKLRDELEAGAGVNLKTVAPIQKRIANLKRSFTQFMNKIQDAQEDTTDLGKEIVPTIEDAQNLVKSARSADKDASGAVDFVKGIKQTIEGKIQIINIEQYVSGAKGFLAQIQSVNFGDQNDKGHSEMALAKAALEKARALRVRVGDLFNRSNTLFSEITDGLNRRLVDLQMSSESSKKTSMSVDDLIAMFEMPLLATKKIETIKDENQATSKLLESGRKLNEGCNNAINDSRNAYYMLTKDYSKLSDATGKLEAVVIGLRYDLNMSDSLEQKCLEHAERLDEQAQDLQKIYVNSSQASDAAVQAAQSYKKIVDAINSAMNASKAAREDSQIALNKSEGVGAKSVKSKAKSDMLSENATKTYDITQKDLMDTLKQAKIMNDNVTGLMDNNNMRLLRVIVDVEYLEGENLGERAKEVLGDAGVVIQKAQDEYNKRQDILDNLPKQEEKMRQIPENLKLVRRHTDSTRRQVEKMNKLLPDTQALLDDLSIRVKRTKSLLVNVKANISELKEKIALAQYQANKINVGLKMQADVAFSLRTPEDVLKEANTHTKITLFTQPNLTDANGLLFYMGPNQKHEIMNDFMSVELQKGKATFRYDLGSGEATIQNDMTLIKGQWYKIEAERIAQQGTLKVSTEVGAKGDKKDTKSSVAKGMSGGQHCLLQLASGMTNIIVGGVPYGFKMPSNVTTTNFTGAMESLSVGKTPVGLWNYNSAYGQSMGAFEKDIFKTVDLKTGYRFNGQGYVKIVGDSEIDLEYKSNVRLDIKTLFPNGLILFMSKKGDFMSVEILNGKIVYQYNLGGGRAVLESNNTYNDGKFHTINFLRRKKKGILKVDDVIVKSGVSRNSQNSLANDRVIYLGGYPGYPNKLLPVNGVNGVGFKGCIDNFMIDTRLMNLLENQGAKDVVEGCVDSMERLISFSKDSTGYAAYPIPDSIKTFSLSLNVKTKLNTTLLVYAGKEKAKSADEFAIYIEKGKIVMTVKVGDNEPLMLTSNNNNYHDGRWHYIAVYRDATVFDLLIDDLDHAVRKYPAATGDLKVDRILYFGGVGNDFLEARKQHSQPLIGCIGDVMFNRAFVNFNKQRVEHLVRVSFGACPIADPTDSPEELPEMNVTEVALPPGTCALPELPQSSESQSKGFGSRFGMSMDSRQEFDPLSNNVALTRGKIQLQFRTISPRGVLFFVASTDYRDYIAVYMHEGSVNIRYNSGKGNDLLRTQIYNDGKWHTLVFAKDGITGHLLLDGVNVQTGSTPKGATSVAFGTPFYVGGVPTSVKKIMIKNAIIPYDAAIAFAGCIINVSVAKQVLIEPSRSIAVSSKCHNDTEIGAFFPLSGGNLILDESFKVGQDLEVELSVRPRVMSGVLLSVHSSNGNDFFLVQLVDGAVTFTINNGGGMVSTKSEPFTSNRICDGKWHKIKAIKTRNTVSLQVDGHNAPTVSGNAGNSVANTEDKLILGSIPEHVSGVETNATFVGCMSNVIVGGQYIYLSSAQATGAVDKDSCPTY